MPYDIYVSRARSYAETRGEAPKEPGVLSRLFGGKKADSPPPRPITSDDFEASMKSAPATKHDEHTYRVRHGEGDPWFVASLAPEGHVLLSTSFSYHRFVRNMVDMLQMGLHIAEALGARVFEESGGREVTKKSFDALTNPNGNYLQLQAATFRSVRQLIDREAKAPLEYPVGPIDLVSEFLVFHVQPRRSATVDAIREALQRDVSGVKVEQKTETAMLLSGSDDGKVLAKAMLRPDADWQIWPAHGSSPFARTASAVADVAECVQRETEGVLELAGRAYDDEMRREVRARMEGLAVDFYAWTQATSGRSASP